MSQNNQLSTTISLGEDMYEDMNEVISEELSEEAIDLVSDSNDTQAMTTNEVNVGTSELGTNCGDSHRSGVKKSSKGQKRQAVSIERKLEVIKWYNQNGKSQADTVRHFENRISRQNLQQWLPKEAEYLKLLNNRSMSIRKRRRLPYKRYAKFPEVDAEVLQWFRTQREARLVVTADLIMSKALDIFGKTPRIDGQRFSASVGWLMGFLGRNRLTSRTVTSVGQKIPENAKDISLLFFARVDHFREEQNGSECNILNMDEMPVYFDSPMNRTYDTIGNKTVPLKTTGSDKIRFSLMLCAYNDGRKCEPAIVFKGLKKVPKKEKFPKGIHIMVSIKGSVNKEIMDEWRTSVYKRRPGGYFFNIHVKRSNGPKYRSLLAIDAASPHRNPIFKKSMATHNDTKVEIIPGGMTPLLQPADLSWNRSVKSSIKKQWSEWMASPKDPKELNKSGGVKRPSYALVAEWSLKAWKALPTQQIIDSFNQCNLGPKRDDSALHSRLRDLLRTGVAAEREEQEPSGLTDTESDDEEESEEVIELIDDSIEPTED